MNSKEKLEIVASHVERISRFNGMVTPSDYLRLKEYARLLTEAIDTKEED